MTRIDLKPLFDGLSRPAMIEGVYLGIRALSHRFSAHALSGLSSVDMQPGYKGQAEAAALKAINSIEQVEGVDVKKLTAERVKFYIHEFSTFLDREIGRTDDAELLARVEEELGRV